MILKIVEDLELYEKFTSLGNAQKHYNEHVTKTVKEFFDEFFNFTSFEEHTDMIPFIDQSQYVFLAKKLQDEPNANGFVISNRYNLSNVSNLCYVKFRKLTFSNLFQTIINMKETYLQQCREANENLVEKSDFFDRVIKEIKNRYYEVAYFTVLDHVPNELRTISYYITSNLRYLIRRKVDELPPYYGIDYFPLKGIKIDDYKNIINIDSREKQLSVA